MQHKNWRVYIADAFAEEAYAGNQAGVVILGETQDFPEDIVMRKIAGELKHSETAFVKRAAGNAFHIRYFTPAEEVDLCGHATIAAFSVLRQENIIANGEYGLITRAQNLSVVVGEKDIWMEMAAPKEVYTFTVEEASELYEAYGIVCPWNQGAKSDHESTLTDHESVVADYDSRGWLPKIVSTGLCDIILPVDNREILNCAIQNEQRVSALSEKYQVVGVHMFCLSEEAGVTAECRNFAPLYTIPEESATGTANGALTYYLYKYGVIEEGCENVFLQGESMGKPSFVKSRLELSGDGKNPIVHIGGAAVISLKGELVNER